MKCGESTAESAMTLCSNPIGTHMGGIWNACGCEEGIVVGIRALIGWVRRRPDQEGSKIPIGKIRPLTSAGIAVCGAIREAGRRFNRESSAPMACVPRRDVVTVVSTTGPRAPVSLFCHYSPVKLSEVRGNQVR